MKLKPSFSSSILKSFGKGKWTPNKNVLNLKNGGGNVRGRRLFGTSKSPVRAFRFK